MTDTYTLPADIQKFVARQKRKRIILSLLWYALWGAGIWHYYAADPARTPNWILPIFIALLLALPLWMCRLWPVLFHRRYTGEIYKIKYKMMSDIPVFSEGLERVERHETAILYVRREDGKKRRIACRRLWRAADRCYKVGDRVRRFPLVPLPQNLSRSPEGGRLCLVCGVLSPDSGVHCAECGRTIIQE